jgi:3-dehydroquinate dehydratase-2
VTRILLIQGPNLAALGHREPQHYGTTTADELDAMVRREAAALGLDADIRHVSREGDAIALIDAAESDGVQGLLINPAGFLYGGRALAERLDRLSIPFVEIHITNIERRGKRSVTAAAADGMIAGFGPGSYVLALSAIRRLLDG